MNTRETVTYYSKTYFDKVPTAAELDDWERRLGTGEWTSASDKAYQTEVFPAYLAYQKEKEAAAEKAAAAKLLAENERGRLADIASKQEREKRQAEQDAKDEAAKAAYIQAGRDRAAALAAKNREEGNPKGLSLDAQIDDLFHHVLGRKPEDAEFAKWRKTFGTAIDPTEESAFVAAAQAELDKRKVPASARVTGSSTGTNVGTDESASDADQDTTPIVKPKSISAITSDYGSGVIPTGTLRKQDGSVVDVSRKVADETAPVVSKWYNKQTKATTYGTSAPGSEWEEYANQDVAAPAPPTPRKAYTVPGRVTNKYGYVLPADMEDADFIGSPEWLSASRPVPNSLLGTASKPTPTDATQTPNGLLSTVPKGF